MICSDMGINQSLIYCCLVNKVLGALLIRNRMLKFAIFHAKVLQQKTELSASEIYVAHLPRLTLIEVFD